MFDPKLSEVLLKTYGAVLGGESWVAALDALVKTVDARGAVIVLQEKGLQFEGFSEVSSYYREMGKDFEFYQRNFSHMEAPAWEKLALYEPGKMMRDTELGLPTPDLDAQPHYQAGIEKLKIRRRVAFRMNENRAWFDAMAIAYGDSVQEVPGQVDELVSALAPHLAKALELTRAFTLLRQRYNAVLSALDRFGVGVALALPTGEVIVSNAEAKRIFQESGTVNLRRDGLIDCGDTDTSALLLDAIRRASRTAEGQDDALVAPMQAQGRSERKPILIDVCSLRDSTAEVERNLAGALVFLIDMETPPHLNVPRFAELHGLTAAESEVCELLALGDSTATIADKRATSVHTASGQVKAVIAKTNCRNRTQLLRLIVKSLPPIM